MQQQQQQQQARAFDKGVQIPVRRPALCINARPATLDR
jgi:hypothetical protein